VLVPFALLFLARGAQGGRLAEVLFLCAENLGRRGKSEVAGCGKVRKSEGEQNKEKTHDNAQHWATQNSTEQY